MTNERMRMITYIIFLMPMALLCIGCASTKPAGEMYRIQQTEGHFTQALWYRGLTEKHHYFEQDRHTLLGGFLSSTTKLFRVPIGDLEFEGDFLFPYSSSEDDSIKVRISRGNPHKVKLRKTPYEMARQKAKRLREKYRERARVLRAQYDQIHNKNAEPVGSP